MPTQPRLRRLAAYVLLVWLFAVASGIVNACVVATELRHAEQAVAHGLHHEHELAAADAAQMADAGDHDHGSGNAKEPCKRLCNEPSVGLQADKQPSNPLGSFWLASAPLPSFHFRSLSGVFGGFAAAEQRPSGTVAIAIAFLRLTL